MKPFPKYTVLFISLIACVLPKRTAQACGFRVWPGEYRFWLLQPDIINQPDLTPFYFASGYLYNQDLNAAKESYPQQNIEEWHLAINGKATKNAIDSLLNYTDPQYFFDEQKQLGKRNDFMRFLMMPQNKELYRYIYFSKKVEQISANPDPWEEDDFPNNNISDVIKEGQALYAGAHTEFIKLRAAFQLVRLYAYNGQQELLNRTYDDLVEPVKSKSWVKTAALYQKAIHAEGLEKTYLLSKVFDKGGYNRSHCLYRFETNLLESTLLLAKNDHERNVLLAMKAFSFPGRSLSIIKTIYQSEPTYSELPFLLLREINKVEDWLVTVKVTDFGMPAVYGNSFWENESYLKNAALNYKNDQAYATALHSFLLKMINDKKSRQPALLHLYTSHLCMLLGHCDEAALHLQKAQAVKKLGPNVQTQIKLNTYLLHLENGFNKSTENEFMKIMQTPAEQLAIYDPEIMKNQLVLYTARKMMQKGDKARGLMLLSRTNRALGELVISWYKGLYQEIAEQATDKDYDEMVQILDKKNKSAFERFITQKYFRGPAETWFDESENSKNPGTYWSRSKLLDVKSTWYLRNHRLEEALVTLKQIPDSFWRGYPYNDYMNGDPFYLNIYNTHVPASADARQLTKKQVVEEMIRLQQLAAKDQNKAALCYYKLANAWYNMTYYGKSWLMVKQWWSGNETNNYYPDMKQSAFNDDYFGCATAAAYYRKALQNTKDKKLAALCFFMVEQCSFNNRYYHVLIKGGKEARGYDEQFQPNYSLAKKNGIDKTYYRSLVQECELYQSFIKQYNKRL